MTEETSVVFSDPAVWKGILLLGVLFGSLLLANVLKRKIPFFRKLLIPNSVLGGFIVLIISTVCFYVKGEYLFNLDFFSNGKSGMTTLEEITYHCLAVGFISLSLRNSNHKLSKERTSEIFSSGALTISTYMIQGIVGIVITIIAYLLGSNIASGSGVLLSFGYGQGTGQALNIGKNFDITLGTNSYSSFGLTMAALGFLTAGIIGVVTLNILKKKNVLRYVNENEDAFIVKDFFGENESPMNESVDKLSIQVALVLVSYGLSYLMMNILGNVIMGGKMIGTIFGFNFLFGVIGAIIVKWIMSGLKKIKLLKRDYTNTFLLNRISGIAFDLMIVSGICAIRIDLITDYIGWILLLGVVGAVVTYFYCKFICRKVFPNYEHEQFLAFFGMLTGTASTGMILLREADPNLKTPVSENLVYQSLPAMLLGFPLLLIANTLTAFATDIKVTVLMLAAIVLIFIVMNLFLFRKAIASKFGKKSSDRKGSV